MALIYLLASPDADLVGIASTGGNVAVEQVCENNLGLLELCGVADVPVSKGRRAAAERPVTRSVAESTARGAWGTPSCRRAIGSSPATTRRRPGCRPPVRIPGELIGVATGPLTNLALALRDEPALPTLLRRLVIMGGAYDYRGNTNRGGRMEHQRRPRGGRRGVRRLVL